LDIIHLLSFILTVVHQLTASHTELFNYKLEITNANEIRMSKPKQNGQLETASGGVIRSQGFIRFPETMLSKAGCDGVL